MASERIRIRSALNLNLFIMQFFGLWAPESFFGTPKIYLYRIYSMLVLGFFFFVYTLSEIINIIKVSPIKIIPGRNDSAKIFDLINFEGEIIYFFIHILKKCAHSTVLYRY